MTRDDFLIEMEKHRDAIEEAVESGSVHDMARAQANLLAAAFADGVHPEDRQSAQTLARQAHQRLRTAANAPATDAWARERMDMLDRVLLADPADAASVLDGADAVKLVQTAGMDITRPDWILRMAPSRGGGNVMAKGEISMLSASGGSGKSALAVQLADAAVRASTRYDDHMGREVVYGEAAGLEVRKGDAVFLTLEDSVEHIGHRHAMVCSTGWHPNDQRPEGLHVFSPDPMMIGSEEKPGHVVRGPQWERLWAAVRDVHPIMVVIDPAFAALAANHNDGAVVRQFLTALRREAEAGDFGILVVHHSAKAARFDADEEHPGYVQGSTQWPDSARGCLYLLRYGADRSALYCAKSNHGPSRWAVVLEPDIRQPPNPEWQPAFGGWRRVGRYSASEWTEHKESLKTAAKEAADGEKAAKRAAELDEKADKVWAILKKHGPMSSNALKAYEGLSNASTRGRVLQHLLGAGRVERSKHPHNPTWTLWEALDSGGVR